MSGPIKIAVTQAETSMLVNAYNTGVAMTKMVTDELGMKLGERYDVGGCGTEVLTLLLGPEAVPLSRFREFTDLYVAFPHLEDVAGQCGLAIELPNNGQQFASIMMGEEGRVVGAFLVGEPPKESKADVHVLGVVPTAHYPDQLFWKLDTEVSPYPYLIGQVELRGVFDQAHGAAVLLNKNSDY